MRPQSDRLTVRTSLPDATISIANVENAHHSTRLLAQTTLRNMLGTHNLHEILSDRETIATSMQVGAQLPHPFRTFLCDDDAPVFLLAIVHLTLLFPHPQTVLDEATENWGIKVERTEMQVPFFT